MSTGRHNHYGHLLQVEKKNLFNLLTLYTSFHDLINVYSRRSGTDNSRGQNFDVNRNLLSLRSFATSFKKSLWSLILYNFFHDFIHVYIAPRQGLTTSWGRHFYVNRNIWSLWSFAASFKKISFEVWFYTISFMILYMYIAPGQVRGRQPPRGKSFDVNINVLSLQSFVASFKKMSLKPDLIHFFHDFIHVYRPKAGADNPLKMKVLCQQKHPVTLVICCKLEKKLSEVWFYTIFSWFYTCI